VLPQTGISKDPYFIYGWRRICQENYSELENPALWDYPVVRDQYAHDPNAWSTSSASGSSKAVLCE
jgi:hypothetical protein